jgi:DNA polymerase
MLNRIALIGEAWGEEEERFGIPFVGKTGQLLNILLHQAGIVREECHITNVFNLRPKPKNDIINLCGLKRDGIPGWPALTKGKYVNAQYAPEITRLHAELRAVNPNLIIALGGTAAWSVLRTSGIRAFRGSTVMSPFGKVLPTYHPSAVARDWTLRPIVLSDLEKARHEAEYPEVIRPERSVWVDPTYDDLIAFETQYINPSRNLSADIETIGNQITCIGFAPTSSISLVVPFYDPRKPDANYWPSLGMEMKVWAWVRRQLLKRKRFIFQNGLYDIGLLWREYGMIVPHAEADTMLLHHALQPEMEKGLGFLGSIYTNEAPWKFEHRRAKTNETLKLED